MPALVDLRSDTVTRPTAGMRQAMAAAEVGDDVYGEDPTVNRLQDVVAELLGIEAALWVPTGTMANQIALRALTEPADEILVGAEAHCWRFESGALGALAGVQTRVLPGDGRFTAAELRLNYRPDDPNQARMSVVSVENTHNLGGGLPWDPVELRAVVATAHELGLKAHLDGARLWNAALAVGASEAALAAGFDAVSICLSKGLGAPAGSLVAGSRALVTRCRRFRKMYGGGLRQAGILAAAGLYAIEHHRARLGDDHRNARALAEALAEVATVDLTKTVTSVVMIDVAPGRAAEVVARAKTEGVLVGAMGAGRIRAVTHMDVDGAGIERAIAVLRVAIGAAA